MRKAASLSSLLDHHPLRARSNEHRKSALRRAKCDDPTVQLPSDAKEAVVNIGEHNRRAAASIISGLGLLLNMFLSYNKRTEQNAGTKKSSS